VTRPPTIQVRFRVDFAPGRSVGPGKIALLEGILETGSLSAAARKLGMSYRRAWLLLDSLNRSFKEPLAAASVGGRGGGGVELTALGREVIGEYRRLEADIGRLAARRWKSVAIAASSEASPATGRRVTRGAPASRAGARARGSKRP
jgi:molybdate transport system regulatory protein